MKAESVIKWANCNALQRIAGNTNGEWVFRGTSVPYSAVLERVGKQTVDQIAAQYPSVQSDQIVELLDFIADSTEPEAAPVTPPRTRWNS